MGLRDITNSRERLKLITLEYSIESDGNFVEEPIIELFCRDAHGNRRFIEVEGFYPSFFVTEQEFLDNRDELLNESMIRHIEVRDGILNERLRKNGSIESVDEAPRERLDDTKCVRIYTVKPSQVSKLRDFFEWHGEADVFFTNRFLIDSVINRGFTIPEGRDRVSFDEIEPVDESGCPDIKPRVHTVDIEVWSGGDFPDTQNPSKPVTAITAHDSYEDSYFCGVLDPSAVSEGSEHSWEENIDWEYPDGITSEQICVDVYQSENALLADYFDFIDRTDPDLMTGWNSSRNDIGSGFDYPYLINRADAINEWIYQELTYENGRIFVSNRGAPHIGGREMFDMLQAYKKTQIHEKRSYSLEYIAQEELGQGKEDIADLDEGWLHNPVEFIKYNIRDVSAVVEIEKAQEVLELYDNIRSVAGCTYSETADSNIGIIDLLFLRQAKNRGITLPTSMEPERGWYYGGKVINPSPGKHRNVVYPDLASLYPYLMWSLNVSPETVFESLAEVKEAGYDEEDVYRAYIDFRDDSEKRNSDPNCETIYYLKPDVETGFVREVVDDLVNMKYEYKGQGKKYDAVKRITNSCFTPDTEVLTPDGIRNITDIEVDDVVYSWNKKTGEMEERRVTETIERPEYDGELVHIQNRNIDLKLTPDHRMIVKRSRRSDDWEITEAGDLNEYTHYETPNRWEYNHSDGIDEVDLSEFTEGEFTVTDNHITGGENHTTFDRYVDGNEFIELLGWFITEGSAYISDDAEPRGDSVQIAQEKSVNRELYHRICNCAESLVPHTSKNSRGVEICGSVYADLLTNICGSGSENKNIPEVVFEDASKEQKELLLEVLMLGDGDSREESNRYSTKSDELRDDLVRLLWELGYKPQYTYDDSGEYNTGVWRIRYTDDDSGKKSKQSFRMYRDSKTETAKNGVYCIQVEGNHTLVAGRNGKFTNIQNCYGVFGDSSSYGVGFRLFDWRLAETITIAGQKVLQHTADEFINQLTTMGYNDAELIGGDTDSVMTTIPSMELSPERIQQDWKRMERGGKPQTDLFKASQAVNKSYDSFMCDEFNICYPSGHKMEVEIESYADSIFFLQDLDSDDPNDGVKKKYSQLVTWDEGEIIEDPDPATKGFKLVRSDTAAITAEVQEGVLHRILKNNEPKDSVKSFLKEKYDAAMDGDMPPEKIGVPSSISSDPMDYGWSIDDETDEVKYFTPQPHIRGARYATANIDGEDITSGSKPLMFYVDGVNASGDLPETYDYKDEFSLNAPTDKADANTRAMKEIDREVDALAVEDVRNIPDEIEINWEKMAEKTIEDAINNIAITMGWSFDDLVTAGSQTGLSQFM